MTTESTAAYDENGFDADGFHRDTGTEFHPITRRTCAGDRYDSEGYDADGYDADGYDSEGYGRDGYNGDGLDQDGNSRCDNGDCDDCECEYCNPASAFDDRLDDYGARAPRRLGWRPQPGVDRTLYAGHEIEMYSDNVEYDDVEYVLRQLDTLYAKHNPMTTTRRCAIAKRDGSLDEDSGGFETVTVPLTREQTYGIFTQFKTLGDGLCSAWDKGDEVGHHIHVSRAAIGPLTLGKLGVFMNCDENRAFLEAIACRPAEFNGFEDGKKLTAPENAERYAVLNITDSTVEFRMFKSNLYTKAILKNYEFCMAAIHFCERSSHGFGETGTSSDPLHFTQFRRFVADNRSRYAFLHEFMLFHPQLRVGYRNNSGLPASVASPKDRSPKFALIRTHVVAGA